MRSSALLLGLLLAAVAAAAARADIGPTREAGALVAQAVHVEHAPRLDGTLDDPLWQAAVPVTDFRQREPVEGNLPSETTQVRILYTSEAIYFGIDCRDSTPKGIVATQLRRDLSQELDDYVEVLIDPDHDRRNAHVFQVNPLGTQRDALITEEGRFEGIDGDAGWDGMWSSEARVTNTGWTATIEIPFATLNVRSAGDVVWGINFKRFIRRKNEEVLWAAWRRVDGAARISREGELQGITGVTDRPLLVVTPYLLVGHDYLAPGAANADLEPGGQPLHTGGIDAKFGLGSRVVANLSVNTDFADSDVDLEQFNLTPYRLFYPEKRQFFLENTGIFSFPIGGGDDNLFFSRTIGVDPISGQEVPIRAGAKVTGPLGDYEIGVLAIGSRADGPIPSADVEVLRAKRSLWEGSYIGAIAINRHSGDPSDDLNRTVGVDSQLVFGDFKAQAYLAQTRSPGVASNESLWGASIRYESNRLDAFWEHRRIGTGFSPEVGFLERQDCICDFLDLTLKWRPELLGIRELRFDNWMQNAPETDHVLESREVQSSFIATFASGAITDNDLIDYWVQHLTTPFNIYKNVLIPVGDYRFLRHQLSFATAKDRKWILQVRERFGEFYGGRLDDTRVTLSLRADERLSLAISEEYERFRLPIPDGRFNVSIGSLQASYSLSRFVTASALVQRDTANEHAYGTNLRLQWHYRPGSDVYLVYTTGQRLANITALIPPEYYEQRAVLKWTYAWQP